MKILKQPRFRRRINECKKSLGEILNRKIIASTPSHPHICTVQHFQLNCFEVPGSSFVFVLFVVVVVVCFFKSGVVTGNAVSLVLSLLATAHSPLSLFISLFASPVLSSLSFLFTFISHQRSKATAFNLSYHFFDFSPEILD